MRILLATNACYMPTRGGSTWSNRVWLERLASRGHECVVVSASPDTLSSAKVRQLVAESRAQGVPIGDAAPPGSAPADAPLDWHGVRVERVAHPQQLVRRLEARIREWRPDWILISSEDFAQALLRAALRLAPERTVYLAHTPQLFPFGPASLQPHPAGAEAVRAAAKVIVIGDYTRGYVESHLRRPAIVVHPPVYGEEPFPDYGRTRGGFVSLINPCAVKGISIFLRLAARFRAQAFAALPGWGTTMRDLRVLGAADVHVMAPCPDIDAVLARTRVLLVPSLWPEGFGLVVIEAMLRGIPVLTSDIGGLPEAKLGTEYVLPVRPIERYRPAFDEHRLPDADVPVQDLGPWAAALRELLMNPLIYLDASRRARGAARRFLASLDPNRLEQALLEG